MRSWNQMRRLCFLASIAGGLLFCPVFLTSATEENAIDWRRGRELLQKEGRGEAITDEEKAELDRFKKAREKPRPQRGRPTNKAGREPSGETSASPKASRIEFDLERIKRIKALNQKRRDLQALTEEETTFFEANREYWRRFISVPPASGRESVGLIPVTELEDAYKGEDGGLYGAKQNDPPPEHLAAARKETARIEPLDAAGKPAKEGRIGVISVGMSNTHAIFQAAVELAREDAGISRNVVLVDCAQGGSEVLRWVANVQNKRGVPIWDHVAEKIRNAGLSPLQVQVAWVNQCIAYPAKNGDIFPRHARIYEYLLRQNMKMLRQRYPNLRVAYLSSRIYAGYCKESNELSPEPFAYEYAFANRWLIRDQIEGAPELNYDPDQGEVEAPLLLWGPYLWADGVKPRKSDGLTYSRDEFASDGIHPNSAGCRKIARLLLDFFKTDPLAKTWFAK